MTQQTDYQHWHLHKDEEGILWLAIDRADSSANSLNWSVLEEFSRIIDSIPQQHVKGLVISSAKPTGFIVGADVKQFAELTDINHAVDLVRQGQKLYDRLAQLSIPTVALISGFCLGGGLELALACDYRIAEDIPKTRLGLPEVLLGIHPGWGGTVRLPKLIGPLPAMDLMLTGRSLSAKVASKLGLVDEAPPKRQLKSAARYYIKHQPPKAKPVWWQQLLSNSLIRPLMASMLRNKMKKKVKEEHYPAPYAIIENWLTNGASGEKAYIDEANSIGKLLLSDTARNLARVYFLQEKLKNLAGDKNYQPQHIHVIGAGTMGGDIAAWCALKGMKVTLEDRNVQMIAPAIKRAQQLFKKRLKQRLPIRDAMDRLVPDPHGNGAKQADVIIEAVFEDLTVKQALFKRIESIAKPDAILATNTSTILIDDIAEALKDPSRLIGIHFFNPVQKMPLVEIVKGEQLTESLVPKVIRFVRQIDRLPIPVKSHPGFLVNRVLTPYLLEAWVLASEGVPITTIDKAAKQFGMPMGPIELADSVGLDVILSASEYLGKVYHFDVPETLKEKVAAGKLGRKSGEGFYQYKDNKLVKPKAVKQEAMDKDIAWRLVIRFVNEAMACLREGIVEDADLLDAAIIFGTGFSPFRGGPIHFIKQLSDEQRKDIYNRLQTNFGERFNVDNFSELLSST